MIEENAIVVGVEADIAMLEVVRRTPCGLCGQTRGCGISLWGKLLGHRDNIFKADNQIDAKIGDMVVVGIEEQALLLSSLTAYGVPLLAMFLGAVLATALSSTELVNEVGRADRNAVIGAVLGLVAGLFWVKGHNAGRGLGKGYRPVILRAEDNRTIQLKCERSE